MKSIGLSDEVYFKLLETKHKHERNRKEVLSYDKIIQILINGERDEKQDKNNKTRDD